MHSVKSFGYHGSIEKGRCRRCELFKSVEVEYK